MAEPEGTLVGTVDEDFAVKEAWAVTFSCWAGVRGRFGAVGGTRDCGGCAWSGAEYSVLARGSAGAHGGISSQVAQVREKVAELTRGIVLGTDLRSSAGGVQRRSNGCGRTWD